MIPMSSEEGIRARYTQLFRYRRSLRRASVSRELAQTYRAQTNAILARYPEPEPMPAGEWIVEFARHVATSLKARLQYRIADFRALKDVIRYARQ